MKPFAYICTAVLAFAVFYGCGKSEEEELPPWWYEQDPDTPSADTLAKADGDLRVLFWNIQNGMWSDQRDNYKNFLAFIKRYDPDVCVWCEAQSIYKTGSTSSMAASDRYFPNGWPEFAKKYGHNYTAIGGYRLYANDYYPQVVTSKYPIQTMCIMEETDSTLIPLPSGFNHTKVGQDYMPIAHGAAIQRINVDGKAINFVTLHLWPHAYSYYAKYVSKQTSDPQSVGGNAQRLHEITYICKNSIQSPLYADQENWLMMGDFNTRSRTDWWYYKQKDNLPENSPMLSSHDYILQNTDYKDIIALKHPAPEFFATRVWVNDAGGKTPPRYDFMYASPAMFSRVTKAYVLDTKEDPWLTWDFAMSNYYNPSDHKPLLVDFDMSK